MTRSYFAWLILLTLSAAPAHAIDITECFQSVPPGETGELQNDLVCVGSSPDFRPGNVYLGDGARLKLNGHSISGGTAGVSTNAGYTPTRITGPGQISGATGSAPHGGCAVSASSPIRLIDVDIHGNDCGIDRIYNHSLVLQNVSITDNARGGISSSLPSPGFGKITGKNVTVADNGGNGIVTNGKAKFAGLTVTGNVEGGLILDSARRSKIAVGTLTGNGAGGDIAAEKAPKLVETACDDSVDLDDGGTLGICAND